MSEVSEIVKIPFSQLVVSPDNVRVVSPNKNSDKQLIASIEARGLLQNLVVNRTNNPDLYEVVAGGRRYAAVSLLVKKGMWDESVELPCRINEEDDTTAVSLSENLHEPMHPADEFMAYQSMVGNGLTEKQIAAEFGVALAHVKKRLRLALVAPQIVQDYRKGKLSIEDVMAFTVEGDQDLQLKCYKELDGHVYPHSIRSYLLMESESSDSRLCKYVGLANYKKAGGAVSTDLFQSRSYLQDVELLRNLVMEKLQKSAAEVEKEGWKSVECTVEGYSAGAGYHRANPTLVGVPDSLEKEIKKLETAMAKLEETEGDWDDAKYEKYEALEKQLDECELKKEGYEQYTDEQKELGKCIVTVDHNGELLIMRGLMSKSDNRRLAAEEGSDSVEASEPNNDLPRVLLDDLGLYRQQIIQAALSRDSKMASDMLYFSICKQVLSDNGYYRTDVGVSVGLVNEKTSLDDLDTTIAGNALVEQLSKIDAQWLNAEDETQEFVAFRQLNSKKKGEVVAYCVARLFGIGLKDESRYPIGEYAAASMDVDYAKHWRPTGENYFKRLNKTALLSLGAEWFGDKWTEEHAKDKKKELVEYFHGFFNEGDGSGLPDTLVDIRDRWMPRGFK